MESKEKESGIFNYLNNIHSSNFSYILFNYWVGWKKIIINWDFFRVMLNVIWQTSELTKKSEIGNLFINPISIASSSILYNGLKHKFSNEKVSQYLYHFKLITYNLKVITHNFRVITFYIHRMITYNLKVISYNSKVITFCTQSDHLQP